MAIHITDRKGEVGTPPLTPAELRAGKEAFDRQWRRAFFDWNDPADEWTLTNYGDPVMRGFRAGYAAALAAVEQQRIEARREANIESALAVRKLEMMP